MILFLAGAAAGIAATLVTQRLARRLFPLDLSNVRIIPPPRGSGRWQVWATSRYPAGGQQIVGRYRTRWAARRVADWLNRGPHSATQMFDARPAVLNTGEDHA